MRIYARQSIIIKMDVEGYEFHALAGMERTLRDNACYLQVELYSERIDELKALVCRRTATGFCNPRHRSLFHQHAGYRDSASVAPRRRLAVAYSVLK